MLESAIPDTFFLWLAGAALVSGTLAYFGAMVGLVLGQFRLPLLVAALSSAPMAAASNLAISSLGAGTGAFTHAREGRVELRLILTIGIPSSIAAYLSSRTIGELDAWWMEAAIGATLLVSAIPIGRRAKRIQRESESEPSSEPPLDESARAIRPGVVVLEVLVGTSLGALSGVVGLLPGTLRLPAMLRLGVDARKAAGTNMAIGFFTGVAGALGAVGSGRVSPWALLIVGSTTFLGAWLGAKRTKSLPTARHFTLIALVLAVVGVWLISRSFLAA